MPIKLKSKDNTISEEEISKVIGSTIGELAILLEKELKVRFLDIEIRYIKEKKLDKMMELKIEFANPTLKNEFKKVLKFLKRKYEKSEEKENDDRIKH